MHHIKYYGWVDRIESNTWYARLVIDGDDNYIAEMIDPLPSDAQEGSLFTIHRTKRGKVYLYWIRGPLFTKRQIKKARQRAREWHKLFFADQMGDPIDNKI